MINPEVVTVTCKRDGTVEVDKPIVQLYWDKAGKPDSIEWEIIDCPPGHRVKIMWDIKAPFGRITEETPGRKIQGTWNTKEKGVFDYAILIVKGKQIVAGIDPKVRNDPTPIGG